MPVKIRLQRSGRKKRPYYHIVIADSRAPRDGKYIQRIGSYNPMTIPATIEIDRDAAFDWLNKGAQPTNTARAILRFKGVMYKKHLQRGVKKGALTQDQADQMLAKWIEDKESKVTARKNEQAAKVRKFHADMFGKAPVVEVPEPEVEEAPAISEETPAVEAVVEEAKENDSEAAAEEKTEE